VINEGKKAKWKGKGRREGRGGDKRAIATDALKCYKRPWF